MGPWCAYFASWVSARAGTPLGDAGQGFARVDDVWSWASRTGRTLKRSDVPRPGDLILWDEHMGVVEKVGPRGELTVVEGNSSDAVSRRNYGPDAGGAWDSCGLARVSRRGRRRPAGWRRRSGPAGESAARRAGAQHRPDRGSGWTGAQ
ncbi:CHAP domain-containing protein [Conexibacter sp. W3-3-2]|uniref:CHAP domain-containing protein n=1 Tax=Conexibacter sp. W3-3-2 TaxID=2675227 RepID=UPI0035C8CF01